MAHKKTSESPAQTIGKLGGRATLKKHGSSHFANLATGRWERERAKKLKGKRAA